MPRKSQKVDRGRDMVSMTGRIEEYKVIGTMCLSAGALACTTVVGLYAMHLGQDHGLALALIAALFGGEQLIKRTVFAPTTQT